MIISMFYTYNIPCIRSFVRSLKGKWRIHFLLLQNRQGKTRISRWFVPVEFEDKLRTQSEVHRIVTTRNPRFTNFLEFKTYKLIYRRYAGLFFTIGCDISDNELSHLELIHLFVETLDKYFGNVCELDIVFHFQKVYRLLDEMIIAGEVLETSKKEIHTYLKYLESVEGSEKTGLFSK